LAKSPSRTTAQLSWLRAGRNGGRGPAAQVRYAIYTQPVQSSLPGAAIKTGTGRAPPESYLPLRVPVVAESAHAPATRWSTLVRILNGLKPGTSHVTGHGGESPAACDQDAARGFLLSFLPSAAIDSVFVHISGLRSAVVLETGQEADRSTWPSLTAHSHSST